MRLGIALGSGSARGWAHIGVLRALEERGVSPTVVCGSSVGSLVGAAYASDQLDRLERWVRGLKRLDVLKLLDASLSGGLMDGTRLMATIGTVIEDSPIDELSRSFAAVATELATGREVWLRSGPMLEAVRISSGYPGLLSPRLHGGRWLVDGGVVNPVPVSLCHALDAEAVIAVNLNSEVLGGRPLRRPRAARRLAGDEGRSRLAQLVEGLLPVPTARRATDLGIFDVVASSINVMQERITRSRLAGEPPDLLLEPRLGHFQLMDFHRAADAIAEGRASVERRAAELDRLLERAARGG